MDLRLSTVVAAKTALFASLFCVLVPVSSVASQTSKRLRSNIDDSNTFVLKGNTRPAIASGLLPDLGPASASQIMPRMSVSFALTAAQQTDLTQLLAAQQNRRSAQYRKFLTPEAYADRFGLNSADIAKVTNWLENNGFSNIEASRSRLSVSFSGSVVQAQSAFHTSIHSYSLNGEAHIANATDPELPKALQGIVSGVDGLHNFQPKALNLSSIGSSLLKPHLVTSGGTNYLVPDDWETIYDVKPLYSAGLKGAPLSGQTYSIAIVGQSDVLSTDLQAFRSAAGLSASNPTVVVVPGTNDPGLQSGDQGVATLDLEWAGAIAPNANILFVVADSNPHNGVQDALQYAINNNVAPIISTSYGQCEAALSSTQFNTQNALFQQAAAQGITIVAATGHAGAAACDTGSPAQKGFAVYFPASSQYVTAIGGTEFNASGGSYFSSSNNANGGSATSYIPEVAWNDGNQAATGGGVSTLVAKPSWQTGAGVPADGQRDIPDLAFTASIQTYGLVYCYSGSCTNGFLNSSSTPAVTGGTAAGPPAFAGVLALLVQQTGSRVGLLNSNLYSLATISSNAFHDVTGGNNQQICTGGSPNCPATGSTNTGSFGYSAGVGYDLVTGLGSIDSYNFVEQWNADIQLSTSPSSVNIATASSATSTVTITPIKNFTGSVTLTCSVAASIAPNVTCSVPSTPVSAPGSATVTITTGNLVNSFKPRRIFPSLPPSSFLWFLAALAALTTVCTARKYRLFHVRSASAWSLAALLVLTLGAISCGSGSSSSALSLSCSLPEPIVGIAYTGGTCTASSGSTPYAFTIVTDSTGTGPLPGGLNLNASTGTITGTPTAAGTFPFTVEVTDNASKTVTSALNLTVQPAPVKSGNVTITATAGNIVNTTNILVTTAF